MLVVQWNRTLSWRAPWHHVHPEQPVDKTPKTPTTNSKVFTNDPVLFPELCHVLLCKDADWCWLWAGAGDKRVMGEREALHPQSLQPSGEAGD